MPWRCELIRGGVVVTHEGPTTIEEIEARVREVDEIFVRDRLRFRIGDFRLLEPLKVSVAEVHSIARYMAFSPLGRTGGRHAVLALPTTFAGMEEAYQFIVGSWISNGLAVETFEDFDEAWEWASAEVD